MRYSEMLAKLHRKDISGVGVAATYQNGNTLYYWYEDFEDSKGIDRADRHFIPMIERGKIRKVDYFYQGGKRS